MRVRLRMRIGMCMLMGVKVQMFEGREEPYEQGRKKEELRQTTREQWASRYSSCTRGRGACVGPALSLART